MTDDGVRLDEPADLLDLRIADGEMSWRIDGAGPLEGSTDGVVRIKVGSWSEGPYRSPEGAFRDSSLEVRVPEIDLASETTHDVRIEFFTGTSPLLLISGETVVPRATLHFVIDIALGALQKVDWREGGYLNLAEWVEFVGIRMLRARIIEVERTVREALDDADFTDADLKALREYPDRLAAVESSARSLRQKWPNAKTAKSNAGFLNPVVVHVDRAADHYGEYVDEAEQGAKDAVGRLSGLISSQQIVLTQQQNQDTKRFQRLVTIVGATVLVPGLVAAVFGAEVGFHGRGTTDAFWALLLLMLGSAAVTYALLRSFEAGVWEDLRDSALGRWVARRSATGRLVILGFLGLALAVVGGAVLLNAPAPQQDSQSKSASSKSTSDKQKAGSLSQMKSPGTSSPAGADEKTSKKSGSQ